MTNNIPRIYLGRSPLENLACSHSFLTVLFLGKLFNVCCGGGETMTFVCHYIGGPATMNGHGPSSGGCAESSEIVCSAGICWYSRSQDRRLGLPQDGLRGNSGRCLSALIIRYRARVAIGFLRELDMSARKVLFLVCGKPEPCNDNYTLLYVCKLHE
jgi:hypothetical protein